MYFIEFENGATRDRVKSQLNRNGIPSKVNFLPIHLESFYRREFKMKDGDLPVTEDVSDRILTIPFHPNIAKGEMDHIISKIREGL